MKPMLILSSFLLIIFLYACTLGVDNHQESLTVFSERHYDTDQVLFDLFEETYDIRVNVISGNADPLINRLQNEGEDTQADVLLIADAGRLARAKDMDLLQPVQSDILHEQIPASYRDTEGYWYGLTKRARVLVYHKDRVSADELSTYEALSEAAFEDRIVTRSSTNIYNQSFMASMIEIMGYDEAKNFAQGLVDNFAKNPSGNDRDQAKFVAQGDADIALMNTYYIGRMMFSADQYEREVAEQVGVFFPNQKTTGTHVNVSAAGVTKYARNVSAAILFLEFLSSPVAQESFASANYEYPVNESVEAHELLQSWGDFKAQSIRLDVLGKHASKAAILMDEVGWD